jgi:putative endonuclease
MIYLARQENCIEKRQGQLTSMNNHRYFVYILECSDHTYYTGVTNNLERRFNEHESGINPEAYTYNRRPVHLMWYEEFKYIDKAILFEKKIKKWSGAKKKALIENRLDQLPELSKKKFDK